jgi:transcriptional regulator GlxA family with amidase domain
MDRRVQHVIDLMQQHLRRGLTLCEMAQAVHLAPEHLCRRFKAETGSPPAKYLKGLRMQKAKELLGTTHLSVKEIMTLVGINDVSHFVRDFRLNCGLTPTQYRALRGGAELGKENVAALRVKIG